MTSEAPLQIWKIGPNHSASMIQDFQDNLVLADQAENLSVWITLVNWIYLEQKSPLSN